jgi:hypothetical protein
MTSCEADVVSAARTGSCSATMLSRSPWRSSVDTSK